MADATPTKSDSGTPGPKYPAPKDKACQFCGVSFTSSSLGRHLDQFIKDKKPKPPDGVHDVEEIRRLRGNITRRQPRNSLRRRETLTPAGTPKGTSSLKDSTSSQDLSKVASPFSPNSSNPKAQAPPPWELTGVINEAVRNGDTNGNGRNGQQRASSRQVAQKVQLDVRNKLTEASDSAKAAELALREVLGSLRAAKVQISASSVPFDFDPLAFDFPALALQCLRPPPTLFSSTQYPSPTSWSIQAPGAREFEALRSYFQEEFRTWKIQCATATTAVNEELQYPPSTGPPRDVKRELKKVEERCAELERQIYDHLQSSYAVWDSLPRQRKDELWLLEMARSIGRRHKEVETLKDERQQKMQRISHLESQIEQLTRLQQPREFKAMPPQTMAVDQKTINLLLEQGLNGAKHVGFCDDSRHTDLHSMVSQSIDRWKAVVVSQRVSSNSLDSQRPLPDIRPQAVSEGAMQLDGQANGQVSSQARPAPAGTVQETRQQLSPEQPHVKRQVSGSTAGHSTDNQGQLQNGVGSSRSEDSYSDGEGDADGDVDVDNAMEATVDADADADGDADGDGDEDADAEMEDDMGYSMMHQAMAGPDPSQQQQVPQQQVPQQQPQHQAQNAQHHQHQQHQQQQQQHQHPQQDGLLVPRTRGHPQRQQDAPYMMRHTVSMPIPRGSITISRSVPSMNAATAMHGNAAMAMHGNGNEAMYMG